MFNTNESTGTIIHFIIWVIYFIRSKQRVLKSFIDMSLVRLKLNLIIVMNTMTESDDIVLENYTMHGDN